MIIMSEQKQKYNIKKIEKWIKDNFELKLKISVFPDVVEVNEEYLELSSILSDIPEDSLRKERFDIDEIICLECSESMFYYNEVVKHIKSEHPEIWETFKVEG